MSSDCVSVEEKFQFAGDYQCQAAGTAEYIIYLLTEFVSLSLKGEDNNSSIEI